MNARRQPSAIRLGLRASLRRGLAVLAFGVFPAAARAQEASVRPPPGKASPRALLEEGRRRYGAGDFANARAYFEEAERRATPRLDPARARFNTGAALQRMGASAAAAERFAEAINTPDLETQAAAWYNGGIVALSRAEALAGGGRPAEAKPLLEQAVESFRNAIRLSPDDLDAKINYEWTLRRKQEIEEQARQQSEQSEPSEPEKKEPGDDPSGEPPEPGETPSESPEPQSGEGDPEPGATEPEDGRDSPGEPSEQGSPDAGEGGREREMTAEDAARLMDALRDDEDAQRRRMRLRLGNPVPVEKDW